jgi:hypothetical protein
MSSPKSAFYQEGMEHRAIDGGLVRTEKCGLSAVGKKADQGHDHNEETKSEIERMEIIHFFKVGPDQHVPVEYVAPIQGKKIVDQEGQLDPPKEKGKGAD